MERGLVRGAAVGTVPHTERGVNGGVRPVIEAFARAARGRNAGHSFP